MEQAKQVINLVAFPKDQLTFYDDFRHGLARTDVVGGYTFIRSSVALFNTGYHQLPLPGGFCSDRQTAPSHAAPGELDWVRAVGQAL